jgi:hypothetical protein
MVFFSGGYSQRREWWLASVVSVVFPAGGARESLVRFEFDSRLFTSQTTLYVSATNGVTRLDGIRSVNGTAEMLEFMLPDLRDELVLAVPLRSRWLYPDDNLDDPLLPVVTFTAAGSASGQFTLNLVEESLTTGVAPWGLEPLVSWAPVTGQVLSRDDYMVPGAVYCRSVGPNPVPAGTVIRIDADQGLSGGPFLRAATSRSLGGPAQLAAPGLRTLTDTGLTRCELTIPNDLAVGNTLVAELDWAAPGGVNLDAAGGRSCVVSVKGEGTPDRPRRLMGVGEQRVARYWFD